MASFGSVARGAVLLLLVLLPARGQSPVAAPATIRSSSTEVLVDLVVRDKRGRPVRDLTAADVTIQSDGKSYAPVSMRWISPAAKNPKPGGEAGSVGSLPSTAAAPTANTAVSDPLREMRFVTVLFEPLPRESARLAQDTANALIEKAAGSNVFFSIVLAREKLKLVQSFTGDQEALKKAVRAVTMKAGFKDADDMATLMVQQLRSVAKNGDEFDQMLRGQVPATPVVVGASAGGTVDGGDFVRAKQAEIAINMMGMADSFQRQYSGMVSLNALRAAIRAVAPLPGRKTIVYVCRGLGSHPSLSPVFQNLIEAANAAGVSIYGVDATGLEQAEKTREAAQMLARAAAASNATRSGGGDKAVTREEAMAFETAEQSAMANPSTLLAELASSTGGLILADSNDSHKMAQMIAEDIASYWELSYSPEMATLDGSFHPIAVKVKRNGVKVQARKGFYALPAGAEVGVAPYEIPLLNALAAKESPRAIPFELAAFDLVREGAKLRGAVAVEIPIKEFDIEELAAEGQFHLRAAVLAVLRDGTGAIVERLGQQIDYRAPLEKLGAARQGTLQWHRPLVAAPGQYTLEVAISDRQSKRLSVARIPVEWKPREAGQLALGAISRVRPEALAAGAQPGLWQYGGAALTPHANARLALAGAKAILPLYLVLEPLGSESPALEAEIYRDGELAAKLAVPMTPARGTPSKTEEGAVTALPQLVSLPTVGLDPGRYEIRFLATQGGQHAERSFWFQLDAAPEYRPKAAPAVAVAVAAAVTEAEPEAAANLTLKSFTPVTAAKALTAAEQSELVNRVRERGQQWVARLTNFLCLQITDRLFDRNGSGHWAKSDSLREMVTYYNGKESYDVLYEGTSYASDRPSAKGVRSFGEFGGLMQIVLGKKVHSQLVWKGLVEMEGRQLHHFTYRVEQSHSGYVLTKENPYQMFQPAYVGDLYAEVETLDIRRITLKTEEIPERFPFQEATHEVDYDFQLIAGVPHLLPVRAVMQTRVGKRKLARSEISFSHYRRWSSDAKVTFNAEEQE